jgi:putative hemolysin
VFTGRLFGNREELRLVMQESAQVFSSEERAMINRVLDLQTLTVRHAMKPLDQAVLVSPETPIAELMTVSRERKLTRLPVIETRDGRKRVVGLVSLNPLLYRADFDPSKRVGEYLGPALFVEENLRLEVALDRFQRGGQRLAIVLAPDGREIGILSLQDVLKVIFGEVSL